MNGEQMMEKVVSNDIYNDEGILLIAKGARVNLTENKIQLFRSLGVLEDIMQDTVFKIKQEDVLTRRLKVEEHIKSSIFFQYSNIDSLYMDKISGLVDDIVHEHKNEPWYLYIKALCGYVEWIYPHTISTAIISALIGSRAGYNENELYSLTLGALLHDIGMLLIPTSLLTKPGQLTIEEKKIIEKHCELGYSMLVDCGVDKKSRKIVLQHHECMDGSGYPNSLTKNEITEFAKIVFVADSFDSATSYRPYKQIKTIDTILDEMLNSPKYESDYVKMLKSCFVS